MFPEPKKEKQIFPKLEKPYKEAVKEAVSRLCGDEERLDVNIQRELDFWLLTFGIESLARRCPEHIANIVIESNELIRKLDWDISTNPEIRAQAVVAIPSSIVSTFSSKNIVGCLFGLELDASHERVTRKEIKNAVEACGMGFELLGVFYKRHLEHSSVDLFYFELGCQEGEVKYPMDLSLFEKTFLKKIETRISVVVPTLSIQTNREEIIKNLLVLGREICFIEDIPQVMILYDHHTHQDIMFTIALARVKKRGDLSVLDLLRVNKENENVIQDQTRPLRNLSKEHTVEGNIFQIQVKNLSRFQKKNSSIDYNLARKHVAQCLEVGLGKIRDYNGGLFSIRDENFEKLKKILPKASDSCLRNFFYSMQPLEQQLVLPKEVLALFFKLFQRFFIEDQLQWLIETSDVKLLIALKYEAKKKLSGDEESLLKSKISYETLVSSQWFYGDFSFQGFILSFDTINHLQRYEKELRERFAQIFSCKAPQPKVLRIAVNNKFDRFDFDPRMGGTSEMIMINSLLFEGLTRLNNKGKVTLACAESYQLASDEKTYTFQLRKELYWSNGDPLTAIDFEYAWKKLLAPDSKTIFDYRLRVILNAQPAKEGKVFLDAVGVKALNSTQLEVRLNHPVPYFLELLTHPLFSPIYPDLDAKNPDWSHRNSTHFICNGPFRPKSFHPLHGFKLEKSPYHWNKENVALDEISVVSIHSQRALELFKNQQLDWLGASFGISKQKLIEHSDGISYLPTPTVFWCCFNLKAFPLSNKKIRQAFFYAVDRQQIIEGISGKVEPAYSPLPKKNSSFAPTKYLEIENKEKAQQFFAEGLRELGISKKEFPFITINLFDTELFYQVGYRFKKQIEEVLGIRCSLLKFDFNELLHKMDVGNHEISTLSWIGWVNDPMHALEFFRSNATRRVGWENAQYQSLIKRAWTVKNQQKKSELLSQAEQLLIDDYVILSLFYGQDM
ncbi:MAG: peptide ABC transporter substrate-binding protein [Simkaniaceae bacterium]|nr:peptide ABC transporter substrate-binding protein [Simkaniaceae bacterium]